MISKLMWNRFPKLLRNYVCWTSSVEKTELMDFFWTLILRYLRDERSDFCWSLHEHLKQNCEKVTLLKLFEYQIGVTSFHSNNELRCFFLEIWVCFVLFLQGYEYQLVRMLSRNIKAVDSQSINSVCWLDPRTVFLEVSIWCLTL